MPAYPAVHTLAALQTALQTSTWIQEGSVDSWYAAFGHTDAAESEADFMSALRAWLATPVGMAYSKVRFNSILIRFNSTLIRH